jgi:hypothetical protein
LYVGDAMMEIETTIIKVADSYYVRVPPAFVEYLNIKTKAIKTAKVTDKTSNSFEVKLPLF